MTALARRRFTRRIVMNLVAAVAVTAIFGLKAATPGGEPAPDMLTIAAR